MRGRLFAPNTLPPAEIFLRPGMHGHVEPFAEVGRFAGFDFLDQQAEGGGGAADVDLVDLLAAGQFEEAFEHGASDGIGGQLGGLAAVGNDEAVVAFGGELGEQAAQFFAQNQERLDGLISLGIQIGQVDRVAHRAVDQEIGDRLGDFDADVFLRFLGAGAQMRRHDHLRQLAQREIGGGRLGFIHIQRRPANLAGLNGREEIGLVDDAAAGAIEHAHALGPFWQTRRR